MQDIYPEGVVTAEELIHEILRRQSSSGMSTSSSYDDGGTKMDSSGHDDCGSSSSSSMMTTTTSGMGTDPASTPMHGVMGKEESEDSCYEGMAEDDVVEGGQEEEAAGCSSFASVLGSELVILDCQNPVNYKECHIRGALNITFPAIMMRRIAAGKIDIFAKSKELKAKVANSRIKFVVYGASSNNDGSIISQSVLMSKMMNDTGSASSDLLAHLIAKKLAANGCRVATLRGGLSMFKELYPEWVELSSSMEPFRVEPCGPGEVPLLGLGSLASLKLQDENDVCDSCIGLDADDLFPVEIVPFLYLGNASMSSDRSLLDKHNIKHILNVTDNLPNVFEGSLRYLQIPISDHWSCGSMLSYFIPAIQFIDEARGKEEGVLVHCLAGISRSVTITMAYIMYKMNLSLNEAYDIVRAKKANISPNFHFMGQLLDFERQLHSQFLSPPAFGSSPDSGIEFDRWQGN